MSDDEVTPEPLYRRRREFLRNGALFAATAAGAGGALVSLLGTGRSDPAGADAVSPSALRADGSLAIARREELAGGDERTPLKAIAGYNNFYEFGIDKSDPAREASSLRTRPWTVTVDGACARPATFTIEDLLRTFPLEERVYRMRCVEAWSMVIPWIGFPLHLLLDRVEPASTARFVTFTSLADRDQMPGLSSPWLDWPYVEGLRLDEARHRLTLLAVGLYGRVLPNQNGAPLRLVVPWKYGFKGAKSIVRISLALEQPRTSWSLAAPDEYGFYANVNPEVDHPRWSQATERRIGELWRRRTLPFNGYGDEVASLYAGMDLRRNF